MQDRAISLRDQGMSQVQIAREMGIHASKVGELLGPGSMICARCVEPLREAVKDRLCGWCREELTRSAVEALTGSVSERIRAIWFLREDQGYSAEVVGLALADRARGRSVDEVLLVLAGEGLGAVA